MTRSDRWLFAALISLCGIAVATPRPLGAQQPADTTVFRSYDVVLWVSDVRKSADFYHRLLGFPLVDYTVGQAKSVQTLSAADPEPYAASFSIGGQRLSLQRDVQAPKPAGVRILIRVSDPAAYSAQLTTRGVSVHAIAGTAWFSVSDPDGHQLEFMYYRPRP